MEGNSTKTNSDEILSKTEEYSEKINEIQEKMVKGIDQALQSTAENLDKTADKMHQTASFFRQRNADSLRNDFLSLIKKYPAHTIMISILIGFLFGKTLSR
jgi:uncharacterized coiled-coil DUF342 family protein